MRSVAILVLLARVAAAHQSSTKYVELRFAGERADITLRCLPGDVTEPMQLAPEARPSAVAAAAAPSVPAYVARWLAVRVSSGPTICVTRDPRARAEDDGFLAVTWSVACGRPIDVALLDFSALFALDRRGEVLVQLDDGAASIRITAATNPVRLDIAPPSRFAFTPERIAFALLIVVVAAVARTYRRAARDAALMLALYELAHLVGALGGIAIPPALAPILLAATVIYAGLETALAPDVRWRAATFAGFGILHGLAHPRAAIADLATALATTAIALAGVLPVIRARALRAPRRRAWIAGAVCAFGAAWLLQVALARW